MKITFNWLKQYVDFPWSPAGLAERLTMLGMEVERLDRVAGEFEGIVVAEIVASEKHPNADKLSVCRVKDGTTERQIVCGAKNYKVGDKVALALPGAVLPETAGNPPLTIKIAKMRGVESQGMLCSAKELTLAEDADGLLILSETAKAGQPLAEYLGRNTSDVILDLEITPNRPDLNSIIGIAREISALTGEAIRQPTITSSVASPPAERPRIEDWIRVEIRAQDLCPRYVARMIVGAEIGPSPRWLRETLEKAGFRTINNVVDVTNYVMLETGQPLHAFDYNLLWRPEGDEAQKALPAIVVRRAESGEEFVTLDGQKRALSPQMLLIADELRPIALAGVMGGQNSEIQQTSRNILLESAYFVPENIRSTSKALALRTDAAYRFERGADIEICDWASQRAAHLIKELAGGHLIQGVIDAYSPRWTPHRICLRHAKVNQLLGVAIPENEQLEYLQRLGLKVVSSDANAIPDPERPAQPGSSVTVEVPHYRIDLKRETNLVEEIARFFGVEKIPATEPRTALGAHRFDSVYDQMAQARTILSALGLVETQGQTLISDADSTLAGVGNGTGIVSPGREELICLANPISGDMNSLRPSLLPGLISILRHNTHHRNSDLALFELGRIFKAGDAGGREVWSLAIALMGQRSPAFWAAESGETNYDYYDLKGALEAFFENFDLKGTSYSARPERHRLFGQSAFIHRGKQTIGECGQLLPVLARLHDLRKPVFLAELDLGLVLSQRSPDKSFQPLPAFPAIRRDIALIVSDNTTHQGVLNSIRAAKIPHLVQVELFDVFRGGTVPSAKKSMAYACTYRHAERTLTDTEVNAAHDTLTSHLKQALPAVVREG